MLWNVRIQIGILRKQRQRGLGSSGDVAEPVGGSDVIMNCCGGTIMGYLLTWVRSVTTMMCQVSCVLRIDGCIDRCSYICV